MNTLPNSLQACLYWGWWIPLRYLQGWRWCEEERIKIFLPPMSHPLQGFWYASVKVGPRHYVPHYIFRGGLCGV